MLINMVDVYVTLAFIILIRIVTLKQNPSSPLLGGYPGRPLCHCLGSLLCHMLGLLEKIRKIGVDRGKVDEIRAIYVICIFLTDNNSA